MEVRKTESNKKFLFLQSKIQAISTNYLLKFGNFYNINTVKKKIVLFSLYCFIIIASLVLYLVFHSFNQNLSSSEFAKGEESTTIDTGSDTSDGDPTDDSDSQEEDTDDATDEKDESDNTNDDTNTDEPGGDDSEDEDSSSDANNDDTDDTDGQNEIVYASRIQLNCPREITISLGANASLLAGYYQVLPAECDLTPSVTVEGLYSYSDDGIRFVDGRIETEKEGIYSLKFTILKSATSYISDSVRIKVVATDERVTQLTKDIYLGSTYDIADIFAINSTATISIKNFDHNIIDYKDGVITPVGAGKTTFVLSMKIDSAYVEYEYEFELNIKEEPLPPKYQLVINSNCDDYYFNVGDKILFSYYLLDINGNNVEQKISVSSSDDTIIRVDDSVAPLLIVDCLKSGKAYITLTCLDDPNIFETIEIVVED